MKGDSKGALEELRRACQLGDQEACQAYNTLSKANP